MGRTEQGQYLLFADFETDPAEDGWTPYVYQEDPPPDVENPQTDEKSRSGRFALRSKKAGWLSPSFPVTPNDYYRLDFHAQTKHAAYWSIFSKDADGNELSDRYSGIDASDDWSEHSYYFRSKDHAFTAQVLFAAQDSVQLLIDDVTIRGASREEATRGADSAFARMPSMSWQPERDRFQHLPRTMKKLRSGSTLRTVMLGDSIMNDTANSPWDVLVEREYPGSRIEIIISVEGGKGCPFYREENRVEKYVLRHQPDLLIIGGISNGSDEESFRDVIRQVRNRQDPEILVMSDPVGTNGDPRKEPRWAPRMAPGSDEYRSRLFRMTQEENVDFFDVRGAWGQYVLESDKPYEWFLRDPIHVNDHGHQVLARILERYFGKNA